MGTASRDSPDGETIDIERVGYGTDVRSTVADGAPRLGRRAAVAGTVVADQADSLLAGELEVGTVQAARVWRATVHEDRTTAGIATLLDAKRPAIGRAGRRGNHCPAGDRSSPRSPSPAGS